MAAHCTDCTVSSACPTGGLARSDSEPINPWNKPMAAHPASCFGHKHAEPPPRWSGGHTVPFLVCVLAIRSHGYRQRVSVVGKANHKRRRVVSRPAAMRPHQRRSQRRQLLPEHPCQPPQTQTWTWGGAATLIDAAARHCAQACQLREVEKGEEEMRRNAGQRRCCVVCTSFS